MKKSIILASAVLFTSFISCQKETPCETNETTERLIEYKFKVSQQTEVKTIQLNGQTVNGNILTAHKGDTVKFEARTKINANFILDVQQDQETVSSSFSQGKQFFKILILK